MDTLLVVEDDVNQSELFRQELEESGYRVVVANLGQEALEKIQDNKIDLVILDLRMPGMDGIEVLGKILNRDNTMPVIIHTAYACYKDNFMTWTADEYVIKCSDMSILKGRIKEVLDRCKTRKALQGQN
jgi:DNA-binding response OmpR family regulator